MKGILGLLKDQFVLLCFLIKDRAKMWCRVFGGSKGKGNCNQNILYETIYL